MSQECFRDKRRLSWVNEGVALVAIAANGNQPTYVAQVARLARSVTRSSYEWPERPVETAIARDGKTGGGTKPGMREAASRLCKRGILVRTEATPPKKKVATPHYTIRPTIQNMAEILRTYGSWVIGDLRRSGFATAIMDNGMDPHLATLLQAPIETVRRLPRVEKEELSYLARRSTRALEVFLEPRFELRMPGSDAKGDSDLLAQLRRLRDAMHLAFVAEVLSSPGMKISEEGWNIGVDITTVVRSGSMSMTLKTAYDSRVFTRRPRSLDKERGKDKTRGGGARDANAC